MCNHDNKREISLKNKEAHKEDHNAWSRRGFLQTLGLASGAGLTLGSFSLSAMSSSAFMPMLGGEDVESRILVLIRLKGGNDGLNTFIPLYDYGTYQNNRPNIAIRQNELTDLNGSFGMPNTMSNLMPLWNDGAMKVINTVGYDNHNLSHFTSTDIWNSANPDFESDENKSGWLGRYILNNDPDYLDDLPSVPGAIKISSGSAISFHNSERIDLAVNFNTPDRLLSIAESGLVYDTQNLPDACYYGEQVGFLRSIMNVTFNYAPQISDAYNQSSNSVSYSNNELSRQLSIVSRLIKGNLGTKLYMVTLDGFDTHENQNQRHPQLMNYLANAVSEFYDDLNADGLDHNVLTMSISEFGRRIRENDGGTDHGTAAPVMMFGPCLNGNGFLGDNPDLSDVDNNGNLKHSVDFRSIYATVLESWLCIDPTAVDTILGSPYERIDNLGIDCLSTSTNEVPLVQDLVHTTRPDGFGSTLIEYELKRPENVNVTVYSIMGQKLANLAHGYHMAGKHQVRFVNSVAGLKVAPLVYKIETTTNQYSGKFIIQ